MHWTLSLELETGMKFKCAFENLQNLKFGSVYSGYYLKIANSKLGAHPFQLGPK